VAPDLSRVLTRLDSLPYGVCGARQHSATCVPGILARVPNSAVLATQHNDDTFEDIWEELNWRGCVQVSTDPAELKKLLAGDPITFYCGFDPTAPSLHLGNLVQLIVMRRLQLAGHHPLGLVGGSTGLIGDPRPAAERALNTHETVAEWTGHLERQMSRFLTKGGRNSLRLVNNLVWTVGLSAIDFLREIGKHYRVGTMLKKDAIATRLASDAGISYTEFSYQILQGFDFLELYRSFGCVLQTGGSDQWGNLTSGTDLIHRVEGATVHAFGTPLITNSDGTKFGKSEGNAIWLDASLCSPYRMYQFWLNTDDRDVIERLKVFTFLGRSRIEELAIAVVTEPFKREAQRVLAAEVTKLVHGPDVTAAVIAASRALFGNGDPTKLEPAAFEAALRELPHITATRDVSVAQILVDVSLATSLSDARRAIGQGGVFLNNVRVVGQLASLAEAGIEPGMVVVRRGKKTLAGLFVV